MGDTKRSQKGERGAAKSSGASKPISFHPLSFEESLDALLSVKPPPKGEAPKKPAKKAGKKRGK